MKELRTVADEGEFLEQRKMTVGEIVSRTGRCIHEAMGREEMSLVEDWSIVRIDIGAVANECEVLE